MGAGEEREVSIFTRTGRGLEVAASFFFEGIVALIFEGTIQ